MADKASEHYELKRIDAKPTKNSGRSHFQKGDGIIYSPSGGDPLFTIDVKEYLKNFPLNEKTWAKVTTDAKKNNTEPILKITLGSEEPKTRVVVVSEIMFLELIEAWMEKYYGE